ncbi:MAG: insulinase family protein [Vicinamibacteria bacterium]
MNAFTSEDQTAYFVRVPKNRLELWAWLESDRLLDPVFREFYSERDVVHEERRMSVESTPLGKFDEELNATFWDASPYKWPVVGWASDIPTYSLQQAKDYFATYYAPNNLTGILAGDFSPAEVKPLLERYFGRIPRGKQDPPPVVTMEPAQLGEKRYNASAETSPTVRIWWKTAPLVHREHSRPRPPLGRSLRPHGAALQGPRPGPAGREQRGGGHRPAQVRRPLRGRVRGQGRKGAGRGRVRGLRGDREAARRRRSRPRSSRR